MLLELSYPIDALQPKWPTNPCEYSVLETNMQRGDVNNTATVHHHLHNGSHVDAPRHFCAQGKTIDVIPIEDFLFCSPLALKIEKGSGERILKAELQAYEKQLRSCDLLLVYTGYGDLRATHPSAYCGDFPSWSVEAAQYLRTEFPKLKGIAMDFLSVDNSVTGGQDGFPVHHALLDEDENHPQRTLLLFEDIDTGKLYRTGVQAKKIYAFPLRFTGLEASPISMIAEI